MSRVILALALLLPMLGCGSTPPPETEAPPADLTDPAYAQRFDEPTDRSISTSQGQEGGVVVLWPRIIPADEADGTRDLASTVQGRLRDLANRVYPSGDVDVRPEPERVCSRAGCSGASLGALILRRGEGCAVVGLVSRPGASPARLVQWAGDVILRANEVAFRDPPESQVSVRDFMRCENLAESLAEAEADIEAALRETQ